MAVAIVAITPRTASAETHTLQPYAYVQSYGENGVNTGYVANDTSRFIIDFEFTEIVKSKFLFGAGDKQIHCIYLNSDSNPRLAWNCRNAGWMWQWDYPTVDGTSIYGADVVNTRLVADLKSTYNAATKVRVDLVWYSSRYATYGEATAMTSTGSSNATATRLFHYGAETAYSTAKIYSFETRANSAATAPVAFFAPTVDASGAAGFTNIVAGTFHGDEAASPATALSFSAGIGDASDYKYEGATFSAKFHAYSADTDTGNVMFGEGEAAGAASAWIARGGTATLTAFPAAGYIFKEWTGDTWAITSGSVSSPEVTVASDRAAQLLATFEPGGDTSLWIGGTSGNFRDSANWGGGIVPGSGSTVILQSSTAATLNNDIEGLAPACIVFPAGSAMVTVTGNPITGLLSVTNNTSGVHHVFSNAVSFAENTVADILAASSSGNYVIWDGGMTMHLPPMDPAAGSSRSESTAIWLAGDVTITGDVEDWSPGVSVGFLRLISHGTLTITHSVTVKGVPNFLVGGNTVLHIEGDLTVQCASGEGYFMNFVNGAMVLDGWAINAGAAACRFSEQANGTGHIESYGIKQMAGAGNVMLNGGEAKGAAGRWTIGEGGILDGTLIWVQDQKSAYITAAADFTVAGDVRLSSGASQYHPRLYVNPNGHTVTFDQSNCAGNTQNSSIIAHGSGTVEVRESMATVPATEFAASNTVTLAVQPGVALGAGKVSVKDEATLEVAASGTLDLTGNSAFSLAADAALAFNFTSRTSPAILLPSSSTIPETVKVKISGGDRPKSGTHTLVSGYDFTGKTVNLVEAPDWVQSVTVDGSGNLVCNVKPGGLIIIFQ